MTKRSRVPLGRVLAFGPRLSDARDGVPKVSGQAERAGGDGRTAGELSALWKFGCAWSGQGPKVSPQRALDDLGFLDDVKLQGSRCQAVPPVKPPEDNSEVVDDGFEVVDDEPPKRPPPRPKPTPKAPAAPAPPPFRPEDNFVFDKEDDPPAGTSVGSQGRAPAKPRSPDKPATPLKNNRGDRSEQTSSRRTRSDEDEERDEAPAQGARVTMTMTIIAMRRRHEGPRVMMTMIAMSRRHEDAPVMMKMIRRPASAHTLTMSRYRRAAVDANGKTKTMMTISRCVHGVTTTKTMSRCRGGRRRDRDDDEDDDRPSRSRRDHDDSDHEADSRRGRRRNEKTKTTMIGRRDDGAAATTRTMSRYRGAAAARH